MSSESQVGNSHVGKSFCSEEYVIAGKQDGLAQNGRRGGSMITNTREMRTKSSPNPEIFTRKIAEKENPSFAELALGQNVIGIPGNLLRGCKDTEHTLAHSC